MAARKPKARFGWPPADKSEEPDEGVVFDGFNILVDKDVPQGMLIPVPTAVHPYEAPRSLANDPSVLEWLLAEDEIKPERPEDIREGMGEGANPRYEPGAYGHIEASSRDITIGTIKWEDHKPLQSDWTKRAAAMLVETGARSAIPEGVTIRPHHPARMISVA